MARRDAFDPFSRPLALWAASFAWWTLAGLLAAINYHTMSASTGAPIGWATALRTELAATWMWVPLTVGVFWLARRYPLERGRWRLGLAIHAVGSLTVVVVRALLIYLVDPFIGWYARPPELHMVLATSVDHNLLLYWLFVGMAHALLFARRSRERALHASQLEAQLAQARLAALSAQLHPHFLFNTLHSLSELVHRDAAAADRMIVRLSELLRRTLAGGAAEIPLREELELLEPYLEIEQIRFGDRLHVEWQIAPDTLELLVPRFILQPLVENALRHGLAPRAAAGKLVVRAALHDHRLLLEVHDDGVGLPAGPAREGIGLANTRARLRQLRGEAHGLALVAAPGGGAIARLELAACA